MKRALSMLLAVIFFMALYTATVSLILHPNKAWAEQEHPPIGFCDKREVVIQYLYDVFGQRPFAGGLAGETSESIIEMTVSQKRGWTILNTTKKPDHYWSCIWMWGTGFVLAPIGEPA